MSLESKSTQIAECNTRVKRIDSSTSSVCSPRSKGTVSQPHAASIITCDLYTNSARLLCTPSLQVCCRQMQSSIATMLARTELLLTVASDVHCIMYTLPFGRMPHLSRKFECLLYCAPTLCASTVPYARVHYTCEWRRKQTTTANGPRRSAHACDIKARDATFGRLFVRAAFECESHRRCAREHESCQGYTVSPTRLTC